MAVDPDVEAHVLRLSVIPMLPKSAMDTAQRSLAGDNLRKHAVVGVSIDVLYEYKETLHCYAPSLGTMQTEDPTPEVGG
jgi:hypothetical protein